jgi:hypothetical protein
VEEQEAPEEARVALLEQGAELLAVGSGGHLQLDQGAQLAHRDVVVVVAREEHDALALELLADELEERVGFGERLLDAREEEVEHVAEQDELVDAVEVRGEQLARLRPGKDRVAGPGAEVEVRHRQDAHREDSVSRGGGALPLRPAGPRRPPAPRQPERAG